MMDFFMMLSCFLFRDDDVFRVTGDTVERKVTWRSVHRVVSRSLWRSNEGIWWRTRLGSKKGTRFNRATPAQDFRRERAIFLWLKKRGESVTSPGRRHCSKAYRWVWSLGLCRWSHRPVRWC